MPAPALALHDTDQVAVAAFPLGAQVYAEPELRLTWGDGRSLLFGDGHAALVGRAELTPSFPRLGVGVRLSPIAVLDLGARASATWFFGAFSSLFPLDGPDVVADEAYKQDAAARGERHAGWAVRLDAYARLKGRVGPVIAVAELEGRLHDLHVFEGDLAWTWEPTEMLVVPAHGWTVKRTGLLFVELVAPVEDQDPKLWVGAVGNWDTAPATGDSNVRLGPLVVWKPAQGAAVPTLFVGAQAWIESRFVPVFPPYSFLAAQWAR